MGPVELVLTGNDLAVDQLTNWVQAPGAVFIDAAAQVKLKAAREVVDKALADNIPVYGLTTGLGAQATNRLSSQAQIDFSWQTLRGRAHAIGNPLPSRVVKAALLVRINTLCKGAAGISPEVVDYLLACLNAGLIPRVGETGSIGAGDLVLNATLALCLFGEGKMRYGNSDWRDASLCIRDAGLSIPALGPRDGLALANHSSVAGALAALAVGDASRVFQAVQTSASLTIEGFQANLSPLNLAVLALRPQPGQQQAASQLLERLTDSDLTEPGAGRRLQDPLSIRNVAQIHGAYLAALEFAETACHFEINGASDNPVVLVDEQSIVSGGAYHTPHLTNAVETLTRACVHVAMAMLARLEKLLSARFTDLPLFLAQPGEHSNGFAPLMKTAEALVGELVYASAPVPLWPSINADGVEDSLTHAPLAAKALSTVSSKLAALTAIEMLVATQAIELRSAPLKGRYLRAICDEIRERCEPLAVDRPLAADVDLLTESIMQGMFAAPD